MGETEMINKRLRTRPFRWVSINMLKPILSRFPLSLPGDIEKPHIEKTEGHEPRIIFDLIRKVSLSGSNFEKKKRAREA
jgi:hypothetical protein